MKSARDQALSLYDKLVDVNYLLLYHEFVDILGINSILSQMFQERGSIIADHAFVIYKAMAAYNVLKVEVGTNLKRFLLDCSCLNRCRKGVCTLNDIEVCDVENGKLEYKPGKILKRANKNF